MRTSREEDTREGETSTVLKATRPLAFHGKKLLQALEAEGLIPPGWRVTSATLKIGVDEAVVLTYDVFVSPDDVLKLQRALARLWSEEKP